MDLMKDPKSGEVYAVKRQQLSRNEDEQEYNDHELCLLSNFECDFIVKLCSYKMLNNYVKFSDFTRIFILN